jgi:hypothetical protein
MDTVFDNFINKHEIENNKYKYLYLIEKDLNQYHINSHVYTVYTDEDEDEDTYWVLKTYYSLKNKDIQHMQKYNNLIIKWLIDTNDKYKKKNIKIYKTKAEEKYKYNKFIIMPNDRLPGDYKDNNKDNYKDTLIKNFNLNSKYSSNIQNAKDTIYNNMKILYDLSAELYNNDTALKLCSIMIKPEMFNIVLDKVSNRNKLYNKKGILEYFFHLVPYLPIVDEYEKITKDKLDKLYIFTSGSDNNSINMIKYDDCLLDTLLFKNLYYKVINDYNVKNNSSLFVFSFRLITNLNNIINNNTFAILTTDNYYLTLLANIMSELHYKNDKFKIFLDDVDVKSVIDEYYQIVMKDITPVNVYIKVNNMLNDTNLNPRYNFIYKKSQYFFKDLKLEYFNSDKKVGFKDGNYNRSLAITELESNSKKEYYNLGKINGYYDTNNENEIIEDPNCGILLIERINKGENVIIIGNGQSGSGKTASLIYLQKNLLDIEGILPKILNKLNKDYTKIIIRLADIYLNWDSKLIKVEKITNKHYMVKPIKKYNGNTDIEKFEFNRNGNRNIEWNITINGENYKLGKFINELFNLREIEPTKNNPDSSRSHVLVLVEIYKNNNLDIPHSKLVICDLAGVEDEFTCNCEQLVNLLNIYRTKSKKYSDTNSVDKKLYFDNYTCDSDDYRTEYQKYFLKDTELDTEQFNLTKERSKTIFNLYRFVNEVKFQLSKYKHINDDDGVIMYPDINDSNLETYQYNNVEKYDDILDKDKINDNIYCINKNKEDEMKKVLREIMIKTSGYKQTDSSNYNLLENTDFYKFYNVSESDDIEKMQKQMFALYNIYMKLYNYIKFITDKSIRKYNDNKIYTTKDDFNKYEKDNYKLRYKAVLKLNESNYLMKNFTNNTKSSLSNIFIIHLQDSLLNGLLLSDDNHIQYETNTRKAEFNNRSDKHKFRNYQFPKKSDNSDNLFLNVVIGNYSHGLYYTKENNNYDDQDFYNKNSFNSMNKKDKLDNILKKKLKKDINTLKFRSDSRKVLYTIFNEYIKKNESKAYTNKINKKYYLYSGFICNAFLLSIERIINQIVGDIIRMKIMIFNCKLRRKEGYFINRSLSEMQSSLSSVILRELNRKTVSEIKSFESLPNFNKIKDKLIILNYLSPISKDCYKDNYKYNDFNFNNLKFNKNATIPEPIGDSYNDNSEIILRIIFDNGKIMGQNYTGFGLDPRIINDISNPKYINDDQYKTTSIMVFTVINLTDDGIVNNPPNPPYINTNNLKRIFNISKYFEKLTNYNILKEGSFILTENEINRLKILEDKFKKYKETFQYRLITYDFYKNNVTIKNNMDDQTFGQIFNVSNKQITNQAITLKIIDLIDSNNKTTLIGTISFDVFTQPFTQLKNNTKYRFYICDAKDDQYTNKFNYTNSIPDDIKDNSKPIDKKNNSKPDDIKDKDDEDIVDEFKRQEVEAIKKAEARKKAEAKKKKEEEAKKKEDVEAKKKEEVKTMKNKIWK